ncbi:hypothetical protein [Streptomyces sp. NPDC051016]|uniref:hypothetical protein n=1 Tax=Streptomyces sp. NPDC051016 TaxID=3365638 RepID=UPI0037BC92DB
MPKRAPEKRQGTSMPAGHMARHRREAAPGATATASDRSAASPPAPLNGTNLAALTAVFGRRAEENARRGDRVPVRGGRFRTPFSLRAARLTTRRDRRRALPRTRASLVPGLPAHLVRAVNAQMRSIAGGVVGFIEKYRPRLRSGMAAGVPTAAEAVYGIVTDSYGSSTVQETAGAALLTSAAYDGGRHLVGLTSVTYDSPPSGPAGRPEDRITGASVKRILKEAADEAELESPGTTYTGTWQADVEAAARAFKSDARVLELLTALSTALFAKISQTFTTQEVEAMLVNGRILVSANEAPAVEALARTTLNSVLADQTALISALRDVIPRENAAAFLDLASLLGERAGSAEQEQRGIQALAQMQLDTGVRDDAQEIRDLRELLGTVRLALTGNLTLHSGGSAEQAGALITDPRYRGRIILVDAGKSPASASAKAKAKAKADPNAKRPVVTHAEQNLLLALVHSKYRGGAQVAGKKRPCACCFLSLKLVDDNGYRVKYDREVGGFWGGTTYRGLLYLADQLGSHDAAKLGEWFRKVLTAEDFRQYVTMVHGLPDEAHTVAASDAVGPTAESAGVYTTSSGSGSIRLEYPAVRSEKKSDDMDEDDEWT